MTIHITDHPAQPVDVVQRNSYMAALSLAEQIMSETTALPTNFDVSVHRWSPNQPELRFYFHLDLPGLRAFRDEQALTESVKTREDGSVYIEAVREDVRGVRVTAWTLSDPKPSAVAA
ncbi:hypothetical protein [Streptomyces acidiscabies]|uniref:hypothetical protein n=1 Tax=Streptomyces acidiscabies TaxID=42234 RepID=UPI00073E93CA|nr:hypothetical protein [Streptomyces acidiscabies]GAQ52123.1 hypothetical protein a10_01904 [Streptomyces acidiscabies]